LYVRKNVCFKGLRQYLNKNQLKTHEIINNWNFFRDTGKNFHKIVFGITGASTYFFVYKQKQIMRISSSMYKQIQIKKGQANEQIT